MGGVSDLNINKWNQSTLFSRMIDFWKTDILTKWHIPYVTMVGRRQFNIPLVTCNLVLVETLSPDDLSSTSLLE